MSRDAGFVNNTSAHNSTVVLTFWELLRLPTDRKKSVHSNHNIFVFVSSTATQTCTKCTTQPTRPFNYLNGFGIEFERWQRTTIEKLQQQLQPKKKYSPAWTRQSWRCHSTSPKLITNNFKHRYRVAFTFDGIEYLFFATPAVHSIHYHIAVWRLLLDATRASPFYTLYWSQRRGKM